MPRSQRPARTDVSEFHHVYVEQVPDGDIVQILRGQVSRTLDVLRGVSEERSLHRYAQGKWSLRELLSHINDGERVFSFRAFWFAREYGDSLPSFDQDAGVARAGADARPWADHLDEFMHLRAATLSLVESLPEEAWERRGLASGAPATVRGLIYVCAGHLEHHLRILRERYL